MIATSIAATAIATGCVLLILAALLAGEALAERAAARKRRQDLIFWDLVELRRGERNHDDDVRIGRTPRP